MKKTLILAIFIATPFFIFSQNIKKTIMISGNINLQFNNYYNNTITPTLYINNDLKFGYAFNKYNILGINVPNSYKLMYVNYTKEEDFIMETGLFYRFVIPFKKVSLFSDVFYNYFTQKELSTDNSDYTLKIRFKGYRYGLGVGMSYFITNNLSVELNIQGSKFYRVGEGYNPDVFESYNSIKTFVGIIYYLPLHKKTDKNSK